MIRVTTLSELTIDGKLSLGPGASSKDLFGFYGEELRAWFHAQRAAHDAIMVGAGTVRADDPELTVRHAPGRNPLRVVPCSRGDLPRDARVLSDGFPTLIAVSRAASDATVADLRARPGVEVVRCGETRVDLGELLERLAERGIERLAVEGGSRLLHSLHEAGRVDRIIIKHIPVIAGAAGAPTYLAPGDGAGPLELARWRLSDWFVKGGVGVSVYEPLEAAA